eukprot:6484077-Ditylum_brightwellii.AAC.1
MPIIGSPTLDSNLTSHLLPEKLTTCQYPPDKKQNNPRSSSPDLLNHTGLLFLHILIPSSSTFTKYFRTQDCPPDIDHFPRQCSLNPQQQQPSSYWYNKQAENKSDTYQQPKQAKQTW